MNIKKTLVFSAASFVLAAVMFISGSLSALATSVVEWPAVETENVAYLANYIQTVSPLSGQIGSVVTIKGTGFAAYGNRIKFGNLNTENNPEYNLSSPDGKTLTFNVPDAPYYACLHIQPYCNMPQVMTLPGNYDISVLSPLGYPESNKVQFTVTTEVVTRGLYIDSLTPSTGKVNSLVTLKGGGFTPYGNQVKFGDLNTENDRRYNFESSDGRTITFYVPQQRYLECHYVQPFCSIPQVQTPPGDYPVTVINSKGQSNTVMYKVVNDSTAVPVISSISPLTGTIGTYVTLSGTGFTPTGNRIKFGSLGSENNPEYSVNSSNGTTLTFNVPSSNYASCWYTSPNCALPSFVPPAGTYSVSVINSNGESNYANFSLTTSTQPVNASITILSPNGGETFDKKIGTITIRGRINGNTTQSTNNPYIDFDLQSDSLNNGPFITSNLGRLQPQGSEFTYTAAIPESANINNKFKIQARLANGAYDNSDNWFYINDTRSTTQPRMYIVSEYNNTDKSNTINVKVGQEFKLTVVRENIGNAGFGGNWVFPDQSTGFDCSTSGTNNWQLSCKSYRKGSGYMYMSYQINGQWYKTNAITVKSYTGPSPIDDEDEDEECIKPYFTQRLRLNSRGDEVELLQDVLFQMGYLKESNITGKFTGTTRNAVKKYQRQNGLEADGIVGVRTRQTLNAQWSDQCLWNDGEDFEML